MTDKTKKKKESQLPELWRKFRRNKLAMLGLAILLVFIFAAIFADVIADYDMRAIYQNRRNRCEAPGAEFIFGTDALGRDIFARILHGSRITLSIAASVTVIAAVVGGTLGALTGYYGGKIDNIVMRLVDIIMSIPSMLFSIAIVAALGPSTVNLLLAMTIGQVPRFTRVVRSMVIAAAADDYVEAAKVCGASDGRIILRHIFPNIIGPIIVQMTMTTASVILTTAGLGFIGLGVQPPAPEWGTMLSEARDFMLTDPHMVLIPGLTIALAVFAFNTIGDGLRDALDPRMSD